MPHPVRPCLSLRANTGNGRAFADNMDGICIYHLLHDIDDISGTVYVDELGYIHGLPPAQQGKHMETHIRHHRCGTSLSDTKPYVE